jgi:hypothetical protein
MQSSVMCWNTSIKSFADDPQAVNKTRPTNVRVRALEPYASIQQLLGIPKVLIEGLARQRVARHLPNTPEVTGYFVLTTC